MTMRLSCRPGVSFELGRLAVLIAPPDRMAALLDLPEIGSFHTLYLYTGFSEVLFRVPPIRSEHVETKVCTSLDDAIAAVSRSFHTVLMVEWSPALAAGLDAEEQGQRMSRLVRALKRRAESAIVIVYSCRTRSTKTRIETGAWRPSLSPVGADRRSERQRLSLPRDTMVYGNQSYDQARGGHQSQPR